MKIIDVQAELTACLRQLGAIVSDDENGPSKTRNADYWFPHHKVVAELKCLNRNYFDDQTFNERLSELYQNWVSRGLARPLRTTSKVNLADLPKDCTDDVTSLIKKRLESSLKNANDQIKATKKSLDVADARGLLFLVNDGNFGLHPGLVRNALSRSLHKYSGINTVIHFTANMGSIMETPDCKVLFWCAWSTKKSKTPVDPEFLQKLKQAWHMHHQQIIGEPIMNFSSDFANLYKLKFVDS